MTAAALILLGLAQVVAVQRPQPLPDGTLVQVLPNGYSYGTDGELAQLGFQLRNGGDRSLRVSGIGGDLPGLVLVDVVASGAPFDFAAVGAGGGPLPAFTLAAGTVIEVNLVYAVRRCDEVPRADAPVPVAVEAGRGRGVLAVRVPGLPSEAPDAGPDDEDPWQRVLVRDLCASP